MKFTIAAFALVAALGANAQSMSTVLAACGTSCPTGPAPDVMVTRTAAYASSGTAPCPSLVVSSMSGNSSSPTNNMSPTPSQFKGAGNQVAGSVGVVAAVVAAALIL